MFVVWFVGTTIETISMLSELEYIVHWYNWEGGGVWIIYPAIVTIINFKPS